MKSIITVLLLAWTLQATDLRSNPKVRHFIHEMIKVHNIKPSYFESLFANVTLQEVPLKILKGVRSKGKKPSKILQKRYPYHGAWDRYKALKVTPLRAKQGATFIRKYRTAFQNEERVYGVPKEIIAALIGIESVYGKNVGKYPVFDTLATLAFKKNRRNRFYQKELEALILFCIRNKIDIRQIKSSHFGAIGLGQFMPSNYEYYGVDFNHDGMIRMQNPVDAIGSIANYLKKNGWRKGEPIAIRAYYKGERFHKYKTGYTKLYTLQKLKGIRPRGEWNYHGKVRLIKLDRAKFDELWIVARNFRVITRYNHSAYYAMSVFQLSREIVKELRNASKK